MTRPAILLVDDEPLVLKTLNTLLADDYRTVSASSGREAIACVEKQDDICAVVMDIRMAGMDGIQAARAIRRLRPDLPVLFHTGYPGDYQEELIESAERPFDYIIKGESVTRLLRSVRNAVEAFALRRRVTADGDASDGAFGMVGRSAPMLKVYELVRRTAPVDTKVMILGETGTGKELVARALHAHSPRAQARLAIFNCNHKSPDLVESELFGHTRGSFTGAVSDRVGLFEFAHGGTVFLDEIGDLDVTTQAKLLRVLETGEYQRIGLPDLLKADVRVLCATHRDLAARVATGEFREDLYYRLKGVQIGLPPLRDRKEDIPLLVSSFRDRLTIERDMPPKIFADDAMAALTDFDWPGNVRQLLDTVETLILLTDSDIVVAADVARCLGLGAGQLPAGAATGLRGRVDAYRRKVIQEALDQADGNIAAAARILQVDRSNLRKTMIELGIQTG